MTRLARFALAVFVSGCTTTGGDDGTTTTGTGASSDASASETTGAVSTTATPTDASTTGADTTGSTPEGWTVVAELGPELGMAMSVWGPSSSDVLVVGGQIDDGSSTGFVLRRTDGGEFERDPLPEATPMLHWVGPAGGDVWVVGRDGATLRREGDAWVAHASGTDVTLWGVWGAAVDDVWAVGGDGVDDAPMLLHFDGTDWSTSVLPGDLPMSSHALFKVWGVDATHVFVAGDGGVLLHGVGPTWGTTYAESIAPFIAVRGRAADDVVAVGGRANARIARFDGTQWQDTTTADAGLNGVWVDDTGQATVVGRLGGIFEVAPGSVEPVPMASPVVELLHAVHGFEDGSRIVVGGTFEGPPPWAGVILEHPG